MLEVENIQHFLVARPPALAARYEFLTFSQPDGAREWVRGLLDKVGTAKSVAENPSYTRWVSVAFTFNGIRALGIDESSLATFPEEFRQGMAARAQILGATGANHPDHWVGGLAGPDLHAIVILFARDAAVAQYIYRALASSLPGRPGMAVWIVASAAVTTYAVGSDTKDDECAHPFLRLVPALLAVAAVSALLVYGVLAFAALALPLDPQHIAFLRTLVISAVSLGLAFAGPRLGRIAMTRMAYVALAFVAAKLLFEDLRHGHMEFTAGSIFLFAITLIAVPRLARMGTKSRAEAHVRTPVRMGI